MSDRVAIIGGSTVGRDHFPWPVLAGEEWQTRLGAEWLPGASLQQTMEIIFLVKKWRVIIGDITIDNGTDPAETFDGFEFVTAGPYSEIAPPTLFGSEAEYVRPAYYVEEHSAIEERESVESAVAPYLYFQGHLILRVGDYGSPIWDAAASAVRPYFVCGMGIAGYDDPEPNPDLSNSSVGNSMFPVPLPAVGTLTLELAAGNMALNLYAEYPAEGWQVDMTVRPEEYWPYANKNGDPIYNTTTGAQILDPLADTAAVLEAITAPVSGDPSRLNVQTDGNGWAAP